MPQPILRPVFVSLKDFPLLRRPEHASRIAAIVSEWAVIEFQLFDLFLTVTRGAAMRPITAVIFDALENLQIRLDLLGRFISMTTPFASEYERLRQEIRRRVKERNTVAHGCWGINDKYPEDIILTKQITHDLRYSVADLDLILGRIGELHQKVGRFCVLVERHFTSQRGTKKPK